MLKLIGCITNVVSMDAVFLVLVNLLICIMIRIRTEERKQKYSSNQKKIW